MVRKFILLLGLVLSAFFSTAQILRRPVAAAYSGFGAYSLEHVDVFSFRSNQASLAQLKNNAIAIYGERRFLLSELNNYTMVAGVTTASGNFGFNANYAGFTDYNEMQLGLAYGRKLGNKLDIGAQINYNSLCISNGYGNASTIGFAIGTIFHVTEKLHTGLEISDPLGGKFGKKQQEKLSSVYTIGFGYDASPKLLINVTIEKEEDQPVNVTAGFQYKLISQLMVRAGMATTTSSAWFGLGLFLRSFRLDITAGYHPQLGVTPGLLLLFNFNSKK